MSVEPPTPRRDGGADLTATLARSAKIAVLLLALVVAGLGLFAWLGVDPSTLPVDYEGFD